MQCNATSRRNDLTDDKTVEGKLFVRAAIKKRFQLCLTSCVCYGGFRIRTNDKKNSENKKAYAHASGAVAGASRFAKTVSKKISWYVPNLKPEVPLQKIRQKQMKSRVSSELPCFQSSVFVKNVKNLEY